MIDGSHRSSCRQLTGTKSCPDPNLSLVPSEKAPGTDPLHFPWHACVPFQVGIYTWDVIQKGTEVM